MIGPRIIFINRFFYPDHSATSQLLSDLAFDLARTGTSVDVITSRLLYDNALAQLPAFELIRGVRVHRVWSSTFGRQHLFGRAFDYGTFYFGAALATWRLARQDSVVVAKTDPPLISVVAAPVARLRRARLVNWLQDLFPEVAGALGIRLVRGPVLQALKYARNLSLRWASMNVVLGTQMEARVNAQGISSDKIQVIHNWADGEAIRPIAPETNLLRKSWGLSDLFVVGYSGNLGRAHEFDTILAAAQRLLARKEIIFLFIGGGAQQAAVESAARERGLTNISFQPYQPRDRLSDSLSTADVHLVSLNPALEGLIVPSKFYGIAAAARPTLFIGDTSGEIARLLGQITCGYAVSTGDAAALAERILELSAAPELRMQMGQNARNAFLQRFDRSVAVHAWRKVLGLA